MHLRRTTNWIDGGEPHLGKIEEIDEIVTQEEVAVLVAEYLLEHHEMPEEVQGQDLYTGETMTIRVKDYL